MIGVGDAVEVLCLVWFAQECEPCAHWPVRRALSERHHAVDFADRIFVLEEAVGTCAGANATTAFMLGRRSNQHAQRLASRIDIFNTCSGAASREHRPST